jgi:putative FmdB family regulatory protein
MPTYDYQCSQCGHEFEEFQSITAPPLRKCPQCKKNSIKRLIGCGGGVIFKGSGFYETDYRSESYKKAAKAEKETISPAKKSTESGKKKNSSAPKADTKKS